MNIRFGSSNERPHTLAASSPFVQQIDVIFPSNDALENALGNLQTSFVKGDITLSGATSIYRSGITMLSVGNVEDVWCIDQRGILTISVVKETYEALGITGQKVVLGHGKGHPMEERHVISIPLHGHTESPASRRRLEDALKTFDAKHHSWTVLCAAEGNTILENEILSNRAVQAVTCKRIVLHDVHTPKMDKLPSKGDEDWEEEINSLFEWVGLVGIGSQRLSVTDSIDPSICLYEPPPSCRPCNVTRLRWKGFLGPAFVQTIINTVVDSLKSAASDDFASITCHGYDMNPVPYLPKSAFQASNKGLLTPLVNPSKGENDVWSMIFLLPSPSSDDISPRWVLAASH
ncbi:ribonuclease P 40kDa subunit-domain-containing protein [Mucidula mucida]|nr:ribonuclease P 40kDa subunit-domain-containing protein [Mucidula mucida]